MKRNNPSTDGLLIDYKLPLSPKTSAPRLGLWLTNNKSNRIKPGGKSAAKDPRGESRFNRRSAQRGAVRVGEKPASGGSQARKISIALLTVACGAGVFATTSSTGNVDTSRFKSTILTSEPKPIPIPTFRFDDVDSIVNESLQTALAANNISRPQSQAFAPQAFAQLLPAAPVEPPGDVAAEPLLPVTFAPLAQRLPAQQLEPAISSGQLKDNYSDTVVVASGDTLSGILYAKGVRSDALGSLLKDNLVEEHLTHLRVGDKINFEYRWDGELDNISVRIARDKRIRISPTETGFATATVKLPLEYERVVTSGTIEQSLYVAAERANLNQSTIMALANIFEWELDFARDIRKGDHFSIVYDRLYRDGKYIGDGEILAAEFIRGDQVHRAIRYTDASGRTDYYSLDGQSKHRAFMRHPVDVVRITSRFDPNRMHPVLHQIRAHKGVDYGAPRGTPIYATANGRVAFAGTKGAYGSTVVLNHGDRHTTLYAHMSKIAKKSKVGAKVKRGDVIGYVGKTGRVTGTHLHYEFQVNGKHVDPLKVELPAATPLDKVELPRLKTMGQELMAQMRSVWPEPSSQIASNTLD